MIFLDDTVSNTTGVHDSLHLCSYFIHYCKSYEFKTKHDSFITLFMARESNQGDLHTTGDDSDLIYVHTRVRVGPTSHKSYSITNWCE